MSMQVRLQRSYRSKNGNVTFVYGVTGNKQDLEQYEAIQGEYFRKTDEGVALWFTTRCIGNSGKLIITTNNKIVPDMSAFDQAASLAEQYGGNFGAELAKAAAQQIIGGTPAVDAPLPTPTAAPANAPSNVDGPDNEADAPF